MKRIPLLFLSVACLGMAADGDIFIHVGDSYKVIPAAEARVLEAHNKWLGEHLNDALKIKEGSTYADLLKHFRLDGGLHGGKAVRFVHHLAWNLKVDIVFDGDCFAKEDPSLKIKSVSRPYLDSVRID